MKATLALLMTVCLIGLVPVAEADTTISQVTNNSYEDSFPRIKGDHVVWQARLDGDWEIFLYNIATGQTSQITNNEYDDLSPQTDGHYVVWQGFYNGEWDVFVWDGIESRTISDVSAEDVSPQIANGYIVWTSDPFGDDFIGPSEVMLYDAEAQTGTVLSATVDPGNTQDDSSPKINVEVVIWDQTDDEDNKTTYMYDLISGTITENPDYMWRDSDQRDGNLRVLTRHDREDREVFLYNDDSNRYHQVTDNEVEDRSPDISGHHLTWMAAGEIYVAESKSLSLINPGDGVALPQTLPPAFTWEGIGYGEFKVHFSGNPDFPASQTLTFPPEEGTWLSETALTPTETDWEAVIALVEVVHAPFYWRVEGKDAAGSVSWSETWRFTTYEDAVTAAQTDTGQARDNGGGSGPCFISTAGFNL